MECGCHKDVAFYEGSIMPWMTMGGIYNSGSSQQTLVSGTAEYLDGFTNNFGIADNITPQATSDNIEVVVDGDYLVMASVSYTGTDGSKYEFEIRKNGVATGIRAEETGDGEISNVAFFGPLTCAKDDLLTIYVEADAVAITTDQAQLVLIW